ncbi:MAG: PadR family transcriptional regulator [Gemmatimonadetes bacterium]|nr:PadR family transcriptional regulator [Gemmatimonadota bacterium]
MSGDGNETSPESLTPLRPVIFQILLILNDEERHGYGIMQDVNAHSRVGLILGPGTLYRTLNEMQRLNLIERSDRRPAPDADDERRRYYRLTEFGRQVATAEAARMAGLVQTARAGDLLS